MHLHRIRAVVISNILYRNPLSEVRFKAVCPHIQKHFQLRLVPGRSARIGEIHQPHASLPHIRLPHVSILFFYQISQSPPLFKQGRFLCDIGIDPHTDF